MLLNMSMPSAPTQPRVRDVSTQIDLFHNSSGSSFCYFRMSCSLTIKKLLSTKISQKMQLDQAKLKSTSPIVLINNDSKTEFHTVLPLCAVLTLLYYLQPFADGPNDGSRMKKLLICQRGIPGAYR